MAEEVLSAAVQVLMEKLIAVATEEINLIRGVEKEVKAMKKSLDKIRLFLHDASTRQVRDESVKSWLGDLEDVAYEAEDILDDLNYEVLRSKIEGVEQVEPKIEGVEQVEPTPKSCFFFSCCSTYKSRSGTAHRIKDLNLKLQKVYDEAKDLHLIKRIFENTGIALPQTNETDSITVDPIVIGRKNDESKIVNMLVQPSNEVLSVIPVTGMGGLGKTTLARSIFKHPQTVDRFKQKRFWVCVSENFDSTILFKRILEQIGPVREGISKEAILRELQEKLKEGNYLLVLDDLWNDQRNKWEEFRNSLLGINSNKGNFCLVTTRSEGVASIVKLKANSYALGKLSVDDCLAIIKARAVTDEEVPPRELDQLQLIGRDIAAKCGGLPLAANMVGATLKGKGIDDWNSFLQSGFSDSNDEEQAVLQVLKVSFDRLPSPLLKRCFAYCSIFPKDTELEKERLIQLWMAEGFLTGNDMESTGSKVYNILLQNCFLQEAVRDKYGNIIDSKMHDLVHDLSCLVSKMEIFNYESCTIKRYPHRLRYLAIGSLDEEAYRPMLDRATYLRTLFWRGDKLLDVVFKNVTNLHVLDLQHSKVKDLTNSIDKLINLRLLDVSSTYIQALPDAICKLFNLQTLRATGYFPRLRSLPGELKRLVSLRHLVIKRREGLQIPPEIGKLTCLQTLQFFDVGDENGRHIEELGSLKDLKGELEILHLERVNDKEEATKAGLIAKANIYKLNFVWADASGNDSNTHGSNNEEVLEGLQPHSNLKSLTIERFKGSHFPSWIASKTVGEVTNLVNLIEIRLIGCDRCEEVPKLGHLPVLKILELNGLTSVKSLGHSFYYPDGASSSSDQRPPPFQALRRLILEDMINLVEWIEAPTVSTNATEASAFCKLESLRINNCRNLECPGQHFPSLEVLRIVKVKSVSRLLDMNSGSNVSSLKELEIEGAGNSGHPQSLVFEGQPLEHVSVSDYDDLKSIRFSGRELTSLASFSISHCKSLTEIMLKDLDYTSLVFLHIWGCKNLTSFQIDYERMPNLNYLAIGRFPKLRSLPKWRFNCLRHLAKLTLGPFSEEEEEEEDMSFTRFCDMLQGIHQLQSLDELYLYGNPHWDSLPDQLQHLCMSTTLTQLLLSYFESVEALPEWLGNLSSLEHLNIMDFKSLKKLPSKEAMHRLTNLSALWINACPLLAELKNPESDLYHSEWPKISHIREVIVFSTAA